MDVSDCFFFSALGRKGKSEAPGRRGSFLLMEKSQEEGFSQESGVGGSWARRVSAGNWGEGDKFLFSGPEFPGRMSH